MRKYVPEKMKLIPEGAERKFKGEIFEVYQWPQEMFDGSVATFEMLRRDDTVMVIAILTAEEMMRLRRGGASAGGAESGVTDAGSAESGEGDAGSAKDGGGAEGDKGVEGDAGSAKDGGGAEGEAGDRIVITYQTQPREDWFYAFPGGRHDNPEETELEAAKRELREETGLSFRNWKLVDARQPHAKVDWVDYIFVATGLIDEVPQELDAGEKIKVLEVTFSELREYAARADAKYLMPEIMHEVRSLDELRELPAVYEY